MSRPTVDSKESIPGHNWIEYRGETFLESRMIHHSVLGSLEFTIDMNRAKKR